MRLLRQLPVYLTLAAALGAAASTAAASNGSSAATIDFQPNGCLLTVTSSKDVSNYTVDGVKTELADGTSVLQFTLGPGTVVTVKAGTTVAEYVAPADLECGID